METFASSPIRYSKRRSPQSWSSSGLKLVIVKVANLLFFSLLLSVYTLGAIAFPTEVGERFCGDMAHPSRSSGPHGKPIMSPVSISLFLNVTIRTNNTTVKIPSPWETLSDTMQYRDGECIGIILTHEEESMMMLTTSQGEFLEQGIKLSGDKHSTPGTGCSGKRYNVLFRNISHHIIWCAPPAQVEEISDFRITAASGESSSFKQWKFTLRRDEYSRVGSQQLLARQDGSPHVNFALPLISAVLSLSVCILFIAIRRRIIFTRSLVYEEITDERRCESQSPVLMNTVSGSQEVEMVQTPLENQ